MSQQKTLPREPEKTAERVALWRALHLQLDSAPHILTDDVGLRLLNPPTEWRARPDMDAGFTRGYRSAIVARARFIEDYIPSQIAQGVQQYVILGAGLDTFAQRLPQVASQMNVFEIDQTGPQMWKIQRLQELNFDVPPWLHFVPVDFEADKDWMARLIESGFDVRKPALVSSTGLSMYLTLEALSEQLGQIARFAHGSTFLMTYMLPVGLVAPAEQAQYRMVQERARASGTPFHSLFTPSEITRLAQKAGFKNIETFSVEQMFDRYFKGRSDGLRPATGEEILIAKN